MFDKKPVILESKSVRQLLALFEERNGRPPTEIEKATIRFYINGDQTELPDMMCFNKRKDLIAFLNGKSYEEIKNPKPKTVPE